MEAYNGGLQILFLLLGSVGLTLFSSIAIGACAYFIYILYKGMRDKFSRTYRK